MGPTPKPASQRQRRNKTTSAAEIAAPPATKLELTDLLGKHLHRLTLLTWNVWWASPLTDEWVDADVPDLVALAALVEAYWRADPADRPKIHAEIRMAAREFGLTPMSRRSLQWEIKRLEETKKPAEPRPRRKSGRATLSVLSGRAS